MFQKDKKKKSFYGTTTLGEKGQVVIPVETRKAMNIKKGEKLLVFGMGHDMLLFFKLSNLEKFASHLENRLKQIHNLLKKTKLK